MKNQNVTLSLPRETLQQVKLIAVKRHTSISRLLADMLEELVMAETGYQQAEQQFLKLLNRQMDLGTEGHIGVTRDELHERA